MNNKTILRGVNLGGWLVLEKWITPSLFEMTEALDEFHLHKLQNPQRIKTHYDNFIKSEDFKFLAENNINALRIPVGYGIFGDYSPYQKHIEYLDFAFNEAEKYGFKIIIDLHTAPGSQNGYDHSGLAGEINWHKNPDNISQTLNVLDRLAERFCSSKFLFGISLLNEPHRNLPIKVLNDFYVRGYNTVRKYCDENIAVLISDAFRPLASSKILPHKNFKNVILDIHFYQCFNEHNKKLSIEHIIKDTSKVWPRVISAVKKNKPIIVGEWSLATNSTSFHKMSQENKAASMKEFGYVQQNIFKNTVGWFFWTYKTESEGGWNFKNSVEDGVLDICE